MHKVQIVFNNGDTAELYGEGQTHAAAAQDVAERVQRAMRGDWRGVGAQIDHTVQTWYGTKQWAIATCGDASVRVEKRPSQQATP